MKAFMDENFLLSNDTAVRLYHNYAAKMPIIDYHCHISPMEIATDRKFENITQVWLGGDHYKWRYMRSCGIEEQYITGNASDHDKFIKWAECLGKAIGNPLYHWSHLELQRYFDYHGALNKTTAEEVWNLCNAKLKDASMSAKNLIRQSNVYTICTTDDPVDSLEYHKMIRDDDSFDVQVLPTFRPDKAMNLEKPDYLTYLQKLSEVSHIEIHTFEDVKKAIRNRMEFFDSLGCRISDHGLEFLMYEPADADTVEQIFSKRLKGEAISRKEECQFKTAFMLFVGEEYHKLDWAMQLHYGCKRDNNTFMFDQIGVDTGFDCINNYSPSAMTADYLNALAVKQALPRTILYSLNPNDNQAIDTMIGCFQNSEAVSKIQHGSAWWFNDNKTGMIDQMTSLANLGNLSGFVGMLTDSRSFLSYTRHEYFRRILCNLIGEWVENGEFENNEEILAEIVQDISYYNAKRYFHF